MTSDLSLTTLTFQHLCVLLFTAWRTEQSHSPHCSERLNHIFRILWRFWMSGKLPPLPGMSTGEWVDWQSWLYLWHTNQNGTSNKACQTCPLGTCLNFTPGDDSIFRFGLSLNFPPKDLIDMLIYMHITRIVHSVHFSQQALQLIQPHRLFIHALE